ncbi:hypothetical protein GVX76_00165 [[Haemophilus] felis]|nr:hypothetical protein [[Haemophilus] felis]
MKTNSQKMALATVLILMCASGNVAMAQNLANLAADKTKIEIGKDASAGSGSNFTIAIGYSAKASKTSAVAIGYKAEAKSYNDIAIGDDTKATGAHSIAIGELSKAAEQYSTAIGYKANTNGAKSIALGSQSKAEKTNTIAIGAKSNALIDQAIAIGGDTSAAAQHSIVVGYRARTQQGKDFAVAIGRSAQSDAKDGIALGSFSKAEAGLSKNGKIGAYSDLNEEEVKAKFIEIEKDTNRNVPEATKIRKEVSTWAPTLGALSIGDFNEGYTRQIQNVAAGTENTDAVNVAQLKKLEENTDKKIVKIDRRVTVLENLEKRMTHSTNRLAKEIQTANAGVSSAMAMAAIGKISPSSKSRFAVGAGVGSYNDAKSVAIGVSGINRSRNVIYNANLSINNEDKVGAAAGILFQF